MDGVISIKVSGNTVNYTISFLNKNELKLTGLNPEIDLCKIKKTENQVNIASNIYFDENGECFYNEKKINYQFLYNDNKIEMDYTNFMELVNEIYNNEHVLPFEIIEKKEEEKSLNKKRKTNSFIDENDFIDNEITKLKVKLEYYKNLFTCVICLNEKKDTVINNCNHLCVCKKCSKKLMVVKNPRCPICRKDINRLSQVFF